MAKSPSDASLLLELGAKIKAARLKKGITQSHLALNCDMEKSSLSKIEAGKVNVSYLTICRLSNCLGVSMAEICCWSICFAISSIIRQERMLLVGDQQQREDLRRDGLITSWDWIGGIGYKEAAINHYFTHKTRLNRKKQALRILF